MADRPAPPASRARSRLSWPGQPNCRYCGQPLDRLRGGLGWCGGPVCATRHRNETARAYYKQSWDEHVGRLEQGVDTHGPEIVTGARDLGVEPADLPVGVLPRQTRPPVPLPDLRREAFLQHVRTIVAESFAAETGAEPGDAPDPRRILDEAPEPAHGNAACAVCQGHCCLLGAGENAFLRTEIIDHVRRNNPELDAEAIVARYAAMIPDLSVEDSCVYHGPRGCVVDRSWRGNLCNRFQCNSKRRTMDRMREQGTDKVLWIAARKQGGESAVAVHDDAQGFRLVEVDPAAGDTDPDRVAAAIAAVRAGLPRKLPELAAPVVAPPGQACRWCGAPISRERARASGSCGSASCEHARAGRRPA